MTTKTRRIKIPIPRVVLPDRKVVARGIGDYAIALALIIEVGTVYVGLKLAHHFHIVHTSDGIASHAQK